MDALPSSGGLPSTSVHMPGQRYRNERRDGGYESDDEPEHQQGHARSTARPASNVGSPSNAQLEGCDSVTSMGDLEIEVMKDLWKRVSVLDPEARVRAAEWLARAARDHRHEPDHDLPF